MEKDLGDGGPVFPSSPGKQSISTPPTTQQVLGKNASRLRCSLFPITEQPEDASSYVSISEDKNKPVLATQTCSTSSLFSIVPGHHVVRFPLLTSKCSRNSSVFHVSKLTKQSENRIWSIERREKHQKHELHSETVVWCAVHANDMLGPYLLDKAKGQRSQWLSSSGHLHSDRSSTIT